MIEMVFNSPDMQTLQDDAVRLGFADEDGNIITTGPTADGGGYFLNIVGDVWTPTGETKEDEMGNQAPVMEQQPGVWGRLRVNGGAENVPEFSPEIIKFIYDQKQECWVYTSDGLQAPDFVQNVGVIA